jgi:purine-binding chemotaxis protein CheW
MPGRPTKLVCFYLHGQEYAAEIAAVKETMTMRPLTRVFLTPSWLAGIINLRGDIVAVLDLAQLIGHGPTVITDDSRIIVVQQADRSAGLIADRLAELRTLDVDSLQSPPMTLPDEAASLLRGIATVEDGRALRVLALDHLFDSERLRVFEHAEGT